MSDANTAAPAAPAAASAAAAPAAPAASPAPAPSAAPAPAPAAGESQTASAPAVDSQGKPGEDGKTAEPVFEYQMPEGVELDKSAADSLTALAKEYGLKPEQAQKVAEIGAQMMQRQVQAHAQTVETWVEQVKADPEIGGAQFDASIAVAQQAMAKFGTPELKDVLMATGLGSHPAVVKFFWQVGKLVSPDTHVTGKSTPAAETDPAKILFPSMA